MTQDTPKRGQGRKRTPGFALRALLTCALVALTFCASAPAALAGQTLLDEANALNAQVVRLHTQGRYREAIPLAQRDLAIRERILGPAHPALTPSLFNLAELYSKTADDLHAAPLYRRVLDLQVKTLGPEHQTTIFTMNQLGVVYMELGEYAKAEPLLQRVLQHSERIHGPNRPETAGSLNNLAELYRRSGAYAKAEPLFRRALAIAEKTLGPEHLNTIRFLNNLAMVYEQTGEYARAEPLLKRALAVREKIAGPWHRDTALSLSNLAELYRRLGDNARAEPLLKRALDIYLRALGPEHPSTANELNNLATLYVAFGDCARAEPLFKRSLAIREKVLGPEHPATANSLNNLAALYKAMGDYARARPLYQKAFALSEKVLGPEHPDTVRNLSNLALMYASDGDYGRAEPLLKRALASRERTYGDQHPSTINNINDLASICAVTGRPAAARQLFRRAQEASGALAEQIMGFATEDRSLLFLETQKNGLECFLSLVDRQMSGDAGAVRDGLTAWLRYKGVLLDAQKRFQEALLRSDDPKVAALAQEFARTRSHLSALTFAGPGKDGPQAYQRQIAELEARRQRLESDLSALSQSFASSRRQYRADAAAVARALPKAAVLIEYARVALFNFKAKDKDTGKRWEPPHYLAFVLRPGAGGQAALVDLGEAGPIDDLVAAMGREMRENQVAKDPAGLTRAKLAVRLHDRVFAPLRQAIGAGRDIFLSPDGGLNLVPFETLQDASGRFLVDDFAFTYLNSGRDLLGFGLKATPKNKVLLLGDPDFDLTPAKREQALHELRLSRGRPAGQVFLRSAARRGGDYPPLPETRQEVQAIAALLGRDCEVFLGGKALEEVLFAKPAPRELHLATHGFFYTEQEFAHAFADAEAGLSGPGAAAPAARPENPLLRSGVVLAGANTSLKSGNPRDNDGILTADKVLSLDLHGTDLVVLSACDTGSGEVKAGQGVYGLRRAFNASGAKGVVMSMWSVPDKETRELMVEFHKGLLSGRLDRARALRQAMLREKDVVRERYGNANPLFWGAFVFAGER